MGDSKFRQNIYGKGKSFSLRPFYLHKLAKDMIVRKTGLHDCRGNFLPPNTSNIAECEEEETFPLNVFFRR